MCGIVGVYHFDQGSLVDPRWIVAMSQRIRHRGPDDEGVFVEGSVGLGMRRLSIIDLSSGHQPVFNETQDLLIFFNGEIYNYREIRTDLESRGHAFSTKSDTETILHAYEEFGPDCTLRLNGMFAFSIFDRRTRELFLARDHVGIKPLYYHVNSQRLAFASEIKSLLLLEDVERDVDQGSLAEYLTFGYVSGDRTLFGGIRRLPAGHWMKLKGRQISIQPYWQLPKAETSNGRSISYYAERLNAVFDQAVKRQMVSDVPLGAFLSGGMDSSSIVAMMRQHSNGPVNTYAIGFADKYAFHNELKDARIVAKMAETNHHEIVAEPDIVSLLPRLVWHLDEPVADSSYIVTYLVSELAAKSVKVILSGVGGDELFGGYRRYLGYTLNRYLSTMPSGLRRSLLWVLSQMPASRDHSLGNLVRLGRALVKSLESGNGQNQYQSLLQVFHPDILQKAGNRAASACPTYAQGIFGIEMEGGDLLQQMQGYDFRHSLVDDLLLLTDKMSMACSLETRVPFLDLELIQLAATIPSKYKIQGLSLRVVQKAAMQRSLPPAILTKKKKGFGCPIGAWVKQDLREYIRDALSSERLKRHGLFNARVVQQTLDDHYSQRADYTDRLMSLLTFEIWYDTFIGNKPLATGT